MKKIAILSLVFLSLSCRESKTHKLTETYNSDIKTYRTELHEGRKGGYLQLTGLHKLDSINAFGKSSENDFVLNVIDIPERLGTISITDSVVTFSPADEVRITSKEDSVLTEMPLTLDKFGSSIRMYHKHVNWQVITRSGSLYLRVWDEKNPAIDAFKGFEFFNLNEDFILEGAFTYYEDAKTESRKYFLPDLARYSLVQKAQLVDHQQRQ